MKTVIQYINEHEISILNESLLAKLINWFKGIYKVQKEQLDTNKETLDIDVKNIKSPEKPMPLKDVIANKSEMELINDKKVGFPIASTIIAQKNKYLVKENPDTKEKVEFQPLVDRYFYVEGKNKYMIGQIIYDTTLKNDNNYVNMINFEVIQNIDNISEIEKYINNVFEQNIKKEGYKGLQYIITHPRVKATLIKFGYKEENSNKNIIFKLIK